jgi:hypothetical protein
MPTTTDYAEAAASLRHQAAQIRRIAVLSPCLTKHMRDRLHDRAVLELEMQASVLDRLASGEDAAAQEDRHAV